MGMSKKPYQQVPIIDCQEPLVPIPLDIFAVSSPHPYQKLGAHYGEKSPYYLRQGAIDRLIAAQTELQQRQPGWRIKIYDAYRPIAVQQFMVDYTFREIAQKQGLNPGELTPQQRENILDIVDKFWALPSQDLSKPPPHSTGAAVDVTLVDEANRTVNMGSPIDEVSPRSYPEHFAKSADPVEQQYDRHRQLLWEIMIAAGFERHPNEWWHFSLGDQMWAWLRDRQNRDRQVIARYGVVT
ncbi:MAG: D-alanyl-D-alanine dipeptidase [Hormoscilla sp. SP12CHS1]|nr:D-alanyl-D-alanine dipeptidase [Hormoscilla sp. SP12CHS1]